MSKCIQVKWITSSDIDVLFANGNVLGTVSPDTEPNKFKAMAKHGLAQIVREVKNSRKEGREWVEKQHEILEL